MGLILALALAVGGQQSVPAPVPAAVVADPPRDVAHPARNQQLLILSHGVGMNALLFHAAGAGPKPLVVLLHGLPGNERNLDLAQAIRRAGWSVLTFSPRGAFGSPGSYSIAHVVEDADAAVDFVRSNAAAYGVDPGRIVIAGHSLGGFAGVLHAAHDPALAGLIVLDGANIAAMGKAAAARGAGVADVAKGFDDLGNILVGATPESLAKEVLSAPPAWDIDRAAPALKAMPVLDIGAKHGIKDANVAFVAALKAAGNARVTGVTLDSDHSFSDHRITLSGAVVDWLVKLP